MPNANVLMRTRLVLTSGSVITYTCGEMLREVPPALLQGHAWFLWVTNQPTDDGETLLRLTVNIDGGLH